MQSDKLLLSFRCRFQRLWGCILPFQKRERQIWIYRKNFKRQCLYSRGDGKHPCCAKWAWEQRGKRTNTQPFGIHPQIFSCTQLKDSRCCSWATCSVSNKSKNNEGIILWYLYCNHKHQCTQALLLWHQSCCVRKSNVVVRSSTTLCTPKPSKVPWCKRFQQQPHLF